MSNSDHRKLYESFRLVRLFLQCIMLIFYSFSILTKAIQVPEMGTIRLAQLLVMWLAQFLDSLTELEVISLSLSFTHTHTYSHTETHWERERSNYFLFLLNVTFQLILLKNKVYSQNCRLCLALYNVAALHYQFLFFCLHWILPIFWCQEKWTWIEEAD